MVFSGIVFLGLFFPAVLLLYFGLPFRKWRNYVLLAASLLFYAWGEPLWVLAMIFTSAVDFINGKWIGKLGESKYRKWPLILSLVLDLGILMIFKYSGFFAGEIFKLAGVQIPAWNRPMPIGISFYTFQSLSYTLDVYRGKTKVQHNFLYYLMYVSMFPQLVAGPIVRYADIAAQIEDRQETTEGFWQGALRFTVGMGKKVILANNAGKAATALLSPALAGGHLPVANAWLGAIFYTFQIYYDFAGYSDMAIGLGKIFGFDYKENFNYPYIARSITDFWRRWHISLSSFFRDYVYIPLGGNRHHLYRNIFVVWALTGLWHGASWNFILWGLYYGLLLILEKSFFGKYWEKWKILGHLVTILLFIYGWVIFYCTDLSFLSRVTRSLLGLDGNRWIDLNGQTWFLSNLWILPIYIIGSTPYPKLVAGRLFATEKARDIAGSLFVLAIFAISLVLLVGQTYNPFLYFRF
ncbi:MBOAT family protein [Clostridiales bacterium COT073_COT-073]|nr:MBOAT family protein [Clostridiales bacterium COT073_COT-073]